MKFNDWNIEALTGYEPITTFYMDFSLSEPFGESAIRDTFNRAFNEWKKNYKYLTELVMVLNWKQWEHCKSNEALTQLYYDLWSIADLYAVTYLKGEELRYFYRTTD